MKHPQIKAILLPSTNTSYLQPLNSQPQHAGGQLGRLLEGEVAPVDDEDEAVDLQLGIFDHRLQRQQDRPQYVHERVPDKTHTVKALTHLRSKISHVIEGNVKHVAPSLEGFFSLC